MSSPATTRRSHRFTRNLTKLKKFCNQLGQNHGKTKLFGIFLSFTEFDDRTFLLNTSFRSITRSSWTTSPPCPVHKHSWPQTAQIPGPWCRPSAQPVMSETKSNCQDLKETQLRPLFNEMHPNSIQVNHKI